jgi:hypothetical protein
VLVGPDGVGKTEVARELIRRRDGRYFHFRPPRRASDLLRSPPADGQPKEIHPGPFPLGPVRLLRNVILFWAGYVASIAPTLRAGVDVVGDRWAYGYLIQPTALKFSGPKWLASLALRALPQPNFVVNLHAAPDTVRRRKPELSLDEIRQELNAWSKLPVPGLVMIDAEPPVSVIVNHLIEEIFT